MDDRVLKAKIDQNTTLYVSAIEPQTFYEYLDEDNLGGSDGYFVTRVHGFGQHQRFEILAKSPSFEAAEDLFDMIVVAAMRREITNETIEKWY